MLRIFLLLLGLAGPLAVQGVSSNVTCSCLSSEYLIFQCSTNKSAVCATCDPSCQTCSGPDADQCATCPALRFLYMSRCISQCPTDSYPDYYLSLCSLCPYGKFQDGASNGSPNCVACDSSCRKCAGLGPANCTACDHSLVLEGGACLYAVSLRGVVLEFNSSLALFDRSMFIFAIQSVLRVQATIMVEPHAVSASSLQVKFYGCPNATYCYSAGELVSLLQAYHNKEDIIQIMGASYEPIQESVSSSSSNPGLSVFEIVGVVAGLVVVVIGGLVINISCKPGNQSNKEKSSSSSIDSPSSFVSPESPTDQGMQASPDVVAIGQPSSLMLLSPDPQPARKKSKHSRERRGKGEKKSREQLPSRSSDQQMILDGKTKELLIWWKNSEFIRGVGVSKAGKPYPWFMGIVSSSSSAAMLSGAKSGSFHFRLTPNFIGYILSVNVGNCVKHFSVAVREGRYQLNGAHVRFRSLPALVQYYTKSNLPGYLKLSVPLSDGGVSYEALIRQVRNLTETSSGIFSEEMVREAGERRSRKSRRRENDDLYEPLHAHPRSSEVIYDFSPAPLDLSPAPSDIPSPALRHVTQSSSSFEPAQHYSHDRVDDFVRVVAGVYHPSPVPTVSLNNTPNERYAQHPVQQVYATPIIKEINFRDVEEPDGEKNLNSPEQVLSGSRPGATIVRGSEVRVEAGGHVVVTRPDGVEVVLDINPLILPSEGDDVLPHGSLSTLSDSSKEHTKRLSDDSSPRVGFDVPDGVGASTNEDTDCYEADLGADEDEGEVGPESTPPEDEDEDMDQAIAPGIIPVDLVDDKATVIHHLTQQLDDEMRDFEPEYDESQGVPELLQEELEGDREGEFGEKNLSRSLRPELVPENDYVVIIPDDEPVRVPLQDMGDSSFPDQYTQDADGTVALVIEDLPVMATEV